MCVVYEIIDTQQNIHQENTRICTYNFYNLILQTPKHTPATAAIIRAVATASHFYVYNTDCYRHI